MSFPTTPYSKHHSPWVDNAGHRVDAVTMNDNEALLALLGAVVPASNGTMVWDGTQFRADAGIKNAQVDAAAAIARSKLDFGTGLVNADISASAGIAASKLSLSYTSFAPTWTSTGTLPVIGNGVVVGRYAQVGKFVHCYGSITFGSTSTFGTGSYGFALPVNAATSAFSASGASNGGSATLYDSSSGNLGHGIVYVSSATQWSIWFGAVYLGSNTNISVSAPWTWATSDFIAWNFCYEAA